MLLTRRFSRPFGINGGVILHLLRKAAFSLGAASFSNQPTDHFKLGY